MPAGVYSRRPTSAAAYADRFWSRVRRAAPDECWLWQAARMSKGYGTMYFNRRAVLAHRIAYELHNGPIPEHDSYHGWCVCHRCDTPLCCNPAHLFLGLNRDNIEDSTIKRRRARKLTDEQVRQMRAAVGTQADIAARFGVSQAIVSYVKRRLLHGSVL